MRRKVRGTVSGIYMCSAALRRGSKRRHGSTAARLSCNKTGFARFFLWLQLRQQIACITPWLTCASALALRALRLSLETI